MELPETRLVLQEVLKRFAGSTEHVELHDPVTNVYVLVISGPEAMIYKRIVDAAGELGDLQRRTAIAQTMEVAAKAQKKP